MGNSFALQNRLDNVNQISNDPEYMSTSFDYIVPTNDLQTLLENINSNHLMQMENSSKFLRPDITNTTINDLFNRWNEQKGHEASQTSADDKILRKKLKFP